MMNTDLQRDERMRYERVWKSFFKPQLLRSDILRCAELAVVSHHSHHDDTLVDIVLVGKDIKSLYHDERRLGDTLHIYMRGVNHHGIALSFATNKLSSLLQNHFPAPDGYYFLDSRVFLHVNEIEGSGLVTTTDLLRIGLKRTYVLGLWHCQELEECQVDSVCEKVRPLRQSNARRTAWVLSMCGMRGFSTEFRGVLPTTGDDPNSCPRAEFLHEILKCTS